MQLVGDVGLEDEGDVGVGGVDVPGELDGGVAGGDVVLLADEEDVAGRGGPGEGDEVGRAGSCDVVSPRLDGQMGACICIRLTVETMRSGSS